MSYIPPACALEAATTETSPAAHDATSKKGLVVGRLQNWKGPIVLCEALRHLGNAAPEFQWLGRDMPFKQAKQSMASYLSKTYPDIWGSKIQPTTLVKSRAETAQWQKRAAFVVIPSTWDVFNLTSVEAMVAGQIVICSDGAGAAELIQDGKNGFTFQNQNAEALADKIATVQAITPQQSAKIKQAARETISELLAPQEIAKKRSEAYKNLFKRGKCARHRRPNAWLENACRPHAPALEPLAFLEHLPLRDVVKFLLKRALKKL